MKCEKCGGEFDPGRAGQRFCTRGCQKGALTRPKLRENKKRKELRESRENMEKMRKFLFAPALRGQ